MRRGVLDAPSRGLVSPSCQSNHAKRRVPIRRHALHAQKAIISLRQLSLNLFINYLAAQRETISRQSKFVQNCGVKNVRVYMYSFYCTVRTHIQNYKFDTFACSAPDTQSRSAEVNIVVLGLVWARI